MRRLLIFLGLAKDPGERWADDLLAPLKRARAEVDLASAVMARVRGPVPVENPALVAARRAARRRAAATLIAVSVTILGGLLIAVVRGGDGPLELWNLTGALGNSLWVVFAAGAKSAGRLLLTSGPLARGVLALTEGIVPILRGAGLVAAGWGILSILFSSFVFAQARRNSTPGHHGGLR